MRRRRRRRRRRSGRLIPGLLIVALIATGGWWIWPDGEPQAAAQTRPAVLAGDTNADAPKIPVVVITDPPPERPKTDRSALATKPGARSAPETRTATERQSAARTPSEPEAQARLSAATDDTSANNAGEEILIPSNGRNNDTQAQPHLPASNAPDPTPLEPDAATTEPQPKPAAPDEQMSSNARIDAALQRYRDGRRLEARTELNRMLQTAGDPVLNRELRRHLARIADETVFSRQTLPNDPLFAKHPLADGEYLSEVQRQYAVPYEMIMMINGIKNANRVRAGQALKVPRGPFHVVIHKSAFRLDLYLQDLYVKSMPVGLGTDSSTPTGGWTVKDRLPNPTFFPPASAEDKRIIGPDDPTNPLGEFWVGLRGISGDAVDQEGFGIHGTIDPTSIGKNASLGCVRMLDDDIRFVYNALVVGKSKVKTVP